METVEDAMANLGEVARANAIVQQIDDLVGGALGTQPAPSYAASQIVDKLNQLTAPLVAPIASRWPWAASASTSASSSAADATATLTAWQLIFDPPLPRLLAPVPGICRALAFLVLTPIIAICLFDLAGYIIVRTLGLSRRRVIVKGGTPPKETDPSGAPSFFDTRPHPTHKDSASSPAISKAPLLSPGAYDGETLLRHRARSASTASEDEWLRTGGQYARVSAVRAAAAAAAATAGISGNSSDAAEGGASSSGARGYDTPDDIARALATPSGMHASLARASGVGVDGMLGGYFDTDVDESGPESGRNSPTVRRRTSSINRLGGGALGFTPVSPPGSGPTVGTPGSASIAAAAETDKFAAAAAADLEP